MDDELASSIRHCAPVLGSIQWEQLRSDVAHLLRRPISNDEFNVALGALVDAGELVNQANGRISRSEPDFPEATLEDPVERELCADACFAKLRLSRADTVFHKTARGGERGTGLFSRPDFTIATVRRMRYDPLRHLDVITFELKNAAGATLMAVHEALAHTRFAHYSFLVCPRSRLWPEHNKELRDACAQHGIGLVMFTIAGSVQPVRISDFVFELHPLRKNPDPFTTQEFLEARMQTRLAELESIAGRQ
jgi:hypothetical protein